MKTIKPVLYIDVDGVLFGHYGSPASFQLRPGVNSFLTWAIDNFQCRWLTSWQPYQLRELMRLMYFRQGDLIEYRGGWDIFKTEAIDPGEDWFWIDDMPEPDDLIKLSDWDQSNRLLKADYYGEFELMRLRHHLELLIKFQTL